MATTDVGNSDPVTPVTSAEVDEANGVQNNEGTPAVENNATRLDTPLTDIPGDKTTAAPHTLPSITQPALTLPGPNAQPASTVAVPEGLEGRVKAIVKDLDGKFEVELRNLYADALQEESNAKRDLYILRQRLATLATDSEEEEEVLLASAKQRVATGLAYLKALQIKLGAPSNPTL